MGLSASGIARSLAVITMHATLRRYELKLPLWLISMLYVGVTLVGGLVLPKLEHEYLANYSHAMSVGFALATLSAIASAMIALIGIVFAIAFIMEAIKFISFYDVLWKLPTLAGRCGSQSRPEKEVKATFRLDPPRVLCHVNIT